MLSRSGILLALVALALCASGGGATEKLLDLGSSDDPEADFAAADLRLERLEAPEWDSYWTELDRYLERPDFEDGWRPYADLADLADPETWIEMRLVRGLHQARFAASSSGFALTGSGRNQTPLYLSIRYKDINLDPSLDRFWGTGTFPDEGPGVSVHGCSSESGDAWLELGDLGGAHDLRWKTETLEIPAEGLAAIDGELRFRISAGMWALSDLYGEIAIDWIKVSDVDERPAGVAFDEAWDVVDGYWPSGAMNPGFSDLADTGLLHEGEPFFPIGLFVVTSHFYWQSDDDNYLTNGRDTGFNLVLYNAWEAHSSTGGWYWGAKDLTGVETYAVAEGQTPVSYPARFLGLPDFFDFAHSYGLMVAPMWTTDMWRWYIYNVGRLDPNSPDLYGYPASPYDGTFAGVVEAAELVVAANKDHPALFMWYIKDEADHLDEYWGSPLESVRLMYRTVTDADGDHPCLVTNMGWRPLMFRHYRETFDIGAFDRYTSSFDGQGSHDEVAEWAEEFVYQTGGARPFIPILETENDFSAGRFGDLETVRLATYLGLIHGAQGVMYFDDPGPNADLAVYDGCGSECGPGWWDRLAELISEVNVLAYRALHRSTSIGLGAVRGESHSGDFYPLEHSVWGEGTTNNPRIHAVYRESVDTGDRYLIAVNAYDEATSATFSITGLEADSRVIVLFENRVIRADEGGFGDAFAPGERHAYLLVPSGITCDLDGSGSCDAGDLAELVRAITDAGHSPVGPADIDRDGDRDGDDCELLLRLLYLS